MIHQSFSMINIAFPLRIKYKIFHNASGFWISTSSLIFSPSSNSPLNPNKGHVSTQIVIRGSEKSKSEAKQPNPFVSRCQRIRPLPAYIQNEDKYIEKGMEPLPSRNKRAYTSWPRLPPVIKDKFPGHHSAQPRNRKKILQKTYLDN